jgi:hypothetical protein
MKHLVRAFVCITLLEGCSTTYEPLLTLPPTDFAHSIDANVAVHPFIASDELVSGHGDYGVVADDYVNKAPPELTQALTKEVVAELSAHRVFRTINTYGVAPDLVLTGRVERFFEHDHQNLWSPVPGYSNQLTNLFRANPYTAKGEIRLTMTLHKPTGEVVGSYVGHSTFNEEYTQNTERRPGDRLNRALAEAVARIRDEMMADPTVPKMRL